MSQISALTTFDIQLKGRVVVSTEVGPVDLAGDVRSKLLEQHLDQVMTRLMAMEDVIDPAVEASLAEGVVDVSFGVTAPNPVEAANQASTLLRTAIHAAGGGTPDWPSVDDGQWGVVLDALNVRSNQLQDA